MIVYYENVNGEKLNLLKAPFRTTENRLVRCGLVGVIGRI